MILWNWGTGARERSAAVRSERGSPPRQGLGRGCVAMASALFRLGLLRRFPLTVGSDYSGRRPPSPEWLRGQGFTFVCRYPDWLPNEKVLSLNEFQGLRASGIGSFSIGKTLRSACSVGTRPGSRTARRHGGRQECWAPGPRSLYFSADFDVTESQQPAVTPTSRGLRRLSVAASSSESTAATGCQAAPTQRCAPSPAECNRPGRMGCGTRGHNPRQVPGGNDDYDLDQAMATEFGQVGAVPYHNFAATWRIWHGPRRMTFRPGGTGTPASPQGFRLDVAYIQAGSNHLLHGWNNPGDLGTVRSGGPRWWL